jgi:putative addiction module component (TIGR02574 family)
MSSCHIVPTPHQPFDLSQLSPAECIRLVQELWTIIRDDAKATPLTSQQKAELEPRDAELESGPVPGIPWVEVRQSLQSP